MAGIVVLPVCPESPQPSPQLRVGLLLFMCFERQITVMLEEKVEDRDHLGGHQGTIQSYVHSVPCTQIMIRVSIRVSNAHLELLRSI